MIISVLNIKGGAGKTTTAVNLAAESASTAKKTVLINNDTQKSADIFINNRKKSLPLIYFNPNELYNSDFTIIDNPPAINHEILERIIKTDVIVIPVKPVVFDIESAKKSLYDISEFFNKRYNKYREVKIFLFFNMVKPNTKQHKNLENIKSQFNLPKNAFFLDTFIKDSIDFPNSVSEGKSLFEYSKKTDFRDLYQEILEKLPWGLKQNIKPPYK